MAHKKFKDPMENDSPLAVFLFSVFHRSYGFQITPVKFDLENQRAAYGNYREGRVFVDSMFNTAGCIQIALAVADGLSLYVKREGDNFFIPPDAMGDIMRLYRHKEEIFARVAIFARAKTRMEGKRNGKIR